MWQTLFISTFLYYFSKLFKNWTTRAMLILTYLSKLFRGRQIGSQVQARIAWRRKVQTIIVKGSWSKWPLDKLQTQDLVFVGPHFRLEHQAMKFIYTFTQISIFIHKLMNISYIDFCVTSKSSLCLRCIANFLVSKTRQLRQSNSSRNQVSWLKLHGCEHECRICCKIQTWSNHPMIPTTKRTFALQHSSKAWCPLTFPSQ